MKAIYKRRPEPGLELADAPDPIPGPGEVGIRVKAGSICGTDAHIYKWDRWAQGRIKPPLILGHEFAGVVDTLGPGVEGFEIGQKVSAEGHIVCGRCMLCRTGNAHICPETSIIGVDRDGAFAERIVMPAGNVWPIDYDVSWEVAPLHDAMGNAFHTALAFPLAGRRVLITGCGPIGMFAARIARACGASWVCATDVNPKRMELAETMGAHATVDSRSNDLEKIVRRETDGLGVDVVFEMSGHPDAIRQGLALVRYGGDVALLGIPADAISIDLAREVIFKGITIKGIIGRKMYETWHRMREFLRSGLFDPSPVVTHVLPYTEFDEAMQTIANGDAGKVVLTF